MKFFVQQSAIIGQVALILCMGSSLVSAQQIREGKWEGSGRIVSGSGQGGGVELALEVQGNRVQFFSGPDADQTVRVESGRAPTQNGDWVFEQCGDDLENLCVTFDQNQPDRIIRYLLHSE
ncbi:MAG: hypothetical protein QNJ46_08645 [Leptolyngbyaceae cyanobacterium MO_188.B28]|nr:hypothetical protein [Leptolyngbyaceae cyanobacterium MO_188.B28]